MRYDRIEQFIMEGGDLEDLIIDQEPLHDADHTFSYYYLRRKHTVDLPIKGCELHPEQYWRAYWNQKKGKG